MHDKTLKSLPCKRHLTLLGQIRSYPRPLSHYPESLRFGHIISSFVRWLYVAAYPKNILLFRPIYPKRVSPNCTAQFLFSYLRTIFIKYILTKFQITCAVYFTVGSEDCLFLNVFVPWTIKPEEKMAVMVWIHGGAFSMGSSSGYYGGVLAAFNDVIVVSINYRLGVNGFFNVPDTDVKGNYGMLDQVGK